LETRKKSIAINSKPHYLCRNLKPVKHAAPRKPLFDLSLKIWGYKLNFVKALGFLIGIKKKLTLLKGILHSKTREIGKNGHYFKLFIPNSKLWTYHKKLKGTLETIFREAKK